MNLQHRIDLLVRLGRYILDNPQDLQHAKEKSGQENAWFIPEFIDLAAQNIARNFLQKEILEKWVSGYPGIQAGSGNKTIGIIMAGNIPLVGFHDWLAVFICRHRAMVKPSSKDQVLIKHLVEKLEEWDKESAGATVFADMLKGCDACIATGSDNSSRYFEYYFGKYPHIIRRNKTAVAILTGKETAEELEQLADDVHLYFGLGCRNVTKLYVPQGYDFVPLLEAFKKYNYLADHHKYKNNYDYNLALHILNKKYYMTSGSILLVEEPSVFSPISQLNYEYYSNIDLIGESLKLNTDLQCIVGQGYVSFGKAQCPHIRDYADGADTLAFLSNL
ncbi:MAG: acyl-CoA reductase [Bacteroidetes bacterium]|nr:acyl-CoA reductase [Bacteroidota bacterium]